MSTDPSTPGASTAQPGRPFRLHIGGEDVREGWKILNVQPLEGVDFIGNATDLSQFADNSILEVYGSHIYEHLDYVRELHAALAEAFRVLRPGGLMRIGVPDLDALCRLMLRPDLDPEKKFFVMRMIYGGHMNAWDYHKVGFNFDLLGQFMWDVGFRDIRRVERFGLFPDATDIVYEGVPISLNVMGTKPLGDR